ncbi:MAG: hypothetical protein AAFU73_10155 [Planctomycetota bacterium]
MIPSAPLAFLFFPSMHAGEAMLIALAAVLIFGGRLPDVLMQGLAHLMRARRALTRMWRETGLEDELRRVRRDIETGMPREPQFDVRSRPGVDDARAAAERARLAALQAGESTEPAEPETIDPDADRREPVRIEPAADAIAADGRWNGDSEVDEPGSESAPLDAGTPEDDAPSGEASTTDDGRSAT